MLNRVCALAASVLIAGTVNVAAQGACGGSYTVKRGDSLSLIADRFYKDAGKWTIIYRSNAQKIASPDAIRVGQSYRLPCVDGLPTNLAGDGGAAVQQDVVARGITSPLAPLGGNSTAAEVARAGIERRARQRGNARINILVGDDYRPFTNRLQMSSGLITDIANRAMVAGEANAQHHFVWVNDRAAHLDPMLSSGMVDMALPWKKPDCTRNATASVCTDYVYSKQLFEMLVVAFQAKQRPVQFNDITDLAGKRVCSPRGHHTGSAGAGAAVLSNIGARLMLPATSQECFKRLVAGEADLVVMNEFSGRVAMADLGYEDAVNVILRRPLSIEGLHAVVHKSNPRAQELITTFNAGLDRIQQSGEYLDVIDRHLSSIWAGL